MAIKFTTGLRNALLGTGDFKTVFTDGVLEIYSGSEPDVEAAETGTKLLRVTVSAGAFVAGAPGNGLEFGTPASGAIAKAAAEAWQGVGLAGGTAGYYRFYDNDYDTGADANAIRFQGSCGVGTGDLRMSSTTITLGATHTIDSFSVTLPATAS